MSLAVFLQKQEWEKNHEVCNLESSKDTQSLPSNRFFIEQKVDIKLVRTKDKLKEWGLAGITTETTSTHISYNWQIPDSTTGHGFLWGHSV